MTLQIVWFVLFVIIVAGYMILDGFDLGVGILHPFVAKTDKERRITLNSIGPIWDGNEVWLILAGGVLFAAFPFVYASLFSGFYVAFMLVLLVLIMRTVAIEFRSKRPSPRWRSLWDYVFFLSSLLIALLLGVAFGNIMQGVTLHENGDVTMTLLELLRPFPILMGLTTIFMLAAHGAIYLAMKTEGALHDRVRKIAPPLMITFFALNTVIVFLTAMYREHILMTYLDRVWPVVFPALALVAVLVSYWMLRQGKDLFAFLASGAMIALLIFSAAAGLFPNLLISSIDPAYNLTIYNGTAEANALTVMLIIALIGLPFVFLYTAGVYYFFRGKVRLDPTSY
jgi:cytochrome d ubiquinol oxidase subunit II